MAEPLTVPLSEQARIQEDGRRVYQAHERRDLLLAAVLAEGGEWTPGRAKRLYQQHNASHLYRASIRGDLAALNRAGHLVMHDTHGRRHFTATARTAVAE